MRTKIKNSPQPQSKLLKSATSFASLQLWTCALTCELSSSDKAYQCDVRCLAQNQLTAHVALLSTMSHFMLSSWWWDINKHGSPLPFLVHTISSTFHLRRCNQVTSTPLRCRGSPATWPLRRR